MKQRMSIMGLSWSRPVAVYTNTTSVTANDQGESGSTALEERILSAIQTWPDRAWLSLPGPVDLGPKLAAHIANQLRGDF
ncbi:hypothetical protein NHONHO_61 [Mycobacterium phage Nhonho]|uniref:hypothetical protein n=1 Tax=Mycobacterium phage Nhonho TaxID=1675553 RepID=UPI0006A3145E|nr:hypothetical protein NHONHO_61 [Mycobacterium phage Nhonho]AKU45457.1 hypothetical protein NHONHO_61 [Mycobacterium phage Nhonho]